jgi:hypothetical protein
VISRDPAREGRTLPARAISASAAYVWMGQPRKKNRQSIAVGHAGRDHRARAFLRRLHAVQRSVRRARLRQLRSRRPNDSLDRTNDRLLRLFHAGYLDRPRAQLDRFPSGSPHIVYALADRGARLLIECDGIEFANTKEQWRASQQQAAGAARSSRRCSSFATIAARLRNRPRVDGTSSPRSLRWIEYPPLPASRGADS